ncbi:MAG: nucleoside hydrolase [Chloroflexi bacterium]|nr:nucleoside hydrolase [Chloroflexota bacterium]
MTSPSAAPQRVIVDTDPGIDDAIAILLAAASPEIRVQGLTAVAGNRPLDQTFRNTRALAELAGLAVPIAAGCADPLLRRLRTAVSHGETGIGGAALPPPAREPAPIHAVDFLIERILASPSAIDVVTLGPLTNLALAIRHESRLAAAIRSLTIMGGALQVPGNTTPVAEFNISVDPHAAQIVLHAGIPTTIIALDVTRRVRLTQSHVERLVAEAGAVGRFVADMIRPRAEIEQSRGEQWGMPLHDPLALAVSFAPHFVKTRPARVDVEIASELTMGQTVANFRPNPGDPIIQCAVDVDANAFLAFVVDRLVALGRRSA